MNYKALLIKYIDHVRQCEGVDFIDQIGDPWGSDLHFTEEEKSEMKKLDNEKALSAPIAVDQEIQENESSYLSTIIERDDQIHKHISRIQELEKEIKEYKKLAKDNVPELVKMLKNRK